ncbi:V-type ATP synthase subunit E [Clostridium sp. MSJ-4]|uniref:V-type proton ATPase subunit E n=1 Tax=Clostridium simiarum TaxID=2841506 RepID=A0ABS6F4U7_9CLOT|nr:MULTISPECIES: V-type ATP synthase subunit E family protein [Clostridium]MBU5592820.1 V-type ATP synthase subunit E [Clostridium simiarum]
MSNINNLVNKILDEANAKKDEILKSAHEEKENIINKKVQEAKSLEKSIIEKSEMESVTRKSRIISNAELKVRNEKLEAKQIMISRVLDEALEKLAIMDSMEYINYIKNRISALDIIGDENLILNSKGKSLLSNEVIQEINQSLVAKGKKGNIRISSEDREFKGGFILEKNGIEINNTFEALINSMKDELEYEIARVLFN